MKKQFLFFVLGVSAFTFGYSQCTTTVSSFPHTESFEGTITWSPFTNTYSTSCLSGDNTWQRRTGTTPSSSTGPASAQQGSYYVYGESSGTCSPSKVFVIKSPCYNLSGKSSADISFYYNMNGAAMGSLTLQVTTNGGSTWTDLWTQSGNQGTAWLNAVVSLNSYVNQTIQLRLRGVTGSSFTSDMAIDNLVVSASGSAGTPDLTITGQSLAAGSVTAGGSVMATCGVTNSGTAASGATSYTGYYLSTNTTYSVDDVLLGVEAVGSVAAGGTSNLSRSLVISSGTAAGNYFILFRADYDNRITESNESNNVAYMALTVGAAPVPGCTDPSAHNYNPAATVDDGSCQTCSDGIQNGDETGVDCGGVLCGPCGTGGPSLWLQNGSSIYYNSGNVGIGTSNPSQKLAVNGKVLAREYEATPTGWSDYVFAPGYALPSLESVAAYIREHGHLPGIPSEAEVLQAGIRLGEMNALLLAKIEELTLHVIALNQEVEQLKTRRGRKAVRQSQRKATANHSPGDQPHE